MTWPTRPSRRSRRPGGCAGLPTALSTEASQGCPKDSTSYYFRTRQALLQAVVERLAELITAEIPALPVTDLDAAAEAITAIIETGASHGPVAAPGTVRAGVPPGGCPPS